MIIALLYEAQKISVSVIPAKAGIQFHDNLRAGHSHNAFAPMDSRLRGNDIDFFITTFFANKTFSVRGMVIP
jgi:hypothetical protein